MKKFITTLSLQVIFHCAYAQNTVIEAEIKALEENHIQAIMQKDTATLRKIWVPDFMVNSPRNMVAIGGQVERVMAGGIAYTSYIFEMEKILIKENIVITMGNETVVPVVGNPKGGQTIKRRYTHIWEKEKNGSWVLIARHANEVCPQ